MKKKKSELEATAPNTEEDNGIRIEQSARPLRLTVAEDGTTIRVCVTYPRYSYQPDSTVLYAGVRYNGSALIF
jgi:hypothetical protein